MLQPGKEVESRGRRNTSGMLQPGKEEESRGRRSSTTRDALVKVTAQRPRMAKALGI